MTTTTTENAPLWTPSAATLVAERLEQVADALNAAAHQARALKPHCDGTIDGLERVTAGVDELIAKVLGAAVVANTAGAIAAETSHMDRVRAVPHVEPGPDDQREADRLYDELCQTPGWGDVPMPADVAPLLQRVDRAIRWLAARDFGARDFLHALSTLRRADRNARLFDTLALALSEAYGYLHPRDVDIVAALGCVRTRVINRRSARQGTS